MRGLIRHAAVLQANKQADAQSTTLFRICDCRAGLEDVCLEIIVLLIG